MGRYEMLLGQVKWVAGFSLFIAILSTTCGEVVEENVIFAESSIQSSSLESCAKKCLNSQRCTFWTYSKSTNGCGIRYYEPSELVALLGVSSELNPNYPGGLNFRSR